MCSCWWGPGFQRGSSVRIPTDFVFRAGGQDFLHSAAAGPEAVARTCLLRHIRSARHHDSHFGRPQWPPLESCQMDQTVACKTASSVRPLLQLKKIPIFWTLPCHGCDVADHFCHERLLASKLCVTGSFGPGIAPGR